MSVLVCLVLLLALTGHSSATYCVCKDGVPDATLQKSIDYACGAGADCSAILQNGACYNPNTVKDHCNYAVNSYYQRKGETTGSCDFAGTATTTAALTGTVASGCVYPSSSSTTTGTPSATPTTSTGNGTGTTTGTPSSTPTSILTPPSSVFNTGLGPTGGDASEGVSLQNLFFASSMTLWFSSLLLLWG